MSMLTSLICFSILSNPTAYELYVERKGEAMKSKRWSIFVRCAIIVVSVWVAAVFKNDDLLTDLLKSAALAFGIFFLVFDYAINLILGRKPWFSYLSKSPIDKKFSKVNWKVRMGVRIVIFVSSLTWFLWN